MASFIQARREVERKAAEEALAMRHENASRIRMDRIKHEVMRCSELVDRAKRVSRQNKEQVTGVKSKDDVHCQERYPATRSYSLGIHFVFFTTRLLEGA